MTRHVFVVYKHHDRFDVSMYTRMNVRLHRNHIFMLPSSQSVVIVNYSYSYKRQSTGIFSRSTIGSWYGRIIGQRFRYRYNAPFSSPFSIRLFTAKFVFNRIMTRSNQRNSSLTWCRWSRWSRASDCKVWSNTGITYDKACIRRL